MKKIALMLVAGLVLTGFVVSQAMAQEGEKPAKKRGMGLRGEVVKVEDKALTIKDKAGKETVVTTDEKTVVTIDRKEAKLADLKPGMRVMITPATGVAAKIMVHTPKPKVEPKPEEKPAEQ
ncbi:MAG: hypothetical protein LLG01_09100 [Planctomycetaceae bacterium]|nr:hypothetical protein [Planctomycetaceae bacterium]